MARKAKKRAARRPWSKADERELVAAFKARVSGVRVTIEKTDLIERTSAGKFRVIVSKLS